MLIGLVPIATTIASAATSGDYTYAVSGSKATITKYNGNGGEITIPSTLGGCPVTGIGDYAFEDCSGLTTVYYTGNEEDLSKIEIKSGNDALTNATIIYNYEPAARLRCETLTATAR